MHWLGLENWLSRNPEVILRRINHGRERLAEAICARWVIWLPPVRIAGLARGAADLWAWRNEVLDFTVQPSVREPVHEQGSMEVVRGAEKQEKTARLREIKTYLSRCKRSRPDAELMLEAAYIQQFLGTFDSALEYAKQALDTFTVLDDPLGIAQAKGQIADILQARGELDQALHIRTKEQLPVGSPI